MSTSVIVCPDAAAIAARALDLLVDGLRPAIRRRGEAHLALTGGSTASALFEQLHDNERSAEVDWSRVHVWQGDERFVPLSHPDSNWAAALREWLDDERAPRVAVSHRHPVPVEAALAEGRDAEWAAERYAAEVERLLPRRAGLPAFDVWLLGVGSDGHILSTFPGSSAVAEEGRAALAVPSPEHIEPHVPRVTLSPHLLRAAGTILVMVVGSGKADSVAACFRSPVDPVRLPGQLAIRPNAVWLLDAGSAAKLRDGGGPQGSDAGPQGSDAGPPRVTPSPAR